MKVLLVDDVDVIRSEVRLVLENYSEITSIIEAENGEEAIRSVIKEAPNIIILDLEMPRMGGFTFLRWLIQNKPTPVVIFSSLNSDQHIFKALNMGAVDFISKPKTYIDDEFKEKFYEKIKAASVAKIVKESNKTKNKNVVIKTESQSSVGKSIIFIGASTGGPTAVQEVLKSIDKYVNSPILVAQHMPPLFTKVFAERLDSLLEYKVKEAEDGELIRNNTVYISPGNMHMECADGRIKLINSLKEDINSPSVNRLFKSGASLANYKKIGIILTGMGNDGAEGIKALKEKNACTICESSLTCVVYGMPKEAKATGCIDFDLPRDAIGQKIIELLEK